MGNFKESKSLKDFPKILLKFGEKSNIEDMFNKGYIRFSPLEIYKNNDESCGINDIGEGTLHFFASSVGFFKYSSQEYIKIEGPHIKSSYFDNGLRKLPISCFSYSMCDSQNSFLNTDYLKKFLKEFPKYDTVLEILNPLEYINLVRSKCPNAYFNKIRYIDNSSDFNVEDYFLSAFIKETKFAFQNEFRICLPKQKISESINIQIGDLKNIAKVVSLNELL
jgi:hypothetical protein